MSVRHLPLCAIACAALLPAAVRAQALAVAIPAPAAALADTTARVRYDIPAQPLAEALAAFGRQSGFRVEASGLAAGADVRSRAVAGELTAPEAIRALLEGTGYRGWFRDDAALVVTPVARRDDAPQSLVRVVITAGADRQRGYAPRLTTTATRTPVALRDVPQAVTVVGAPQIADQAMQNMTDVVRYVPGITMGQGEGHRDAPTIRGQASTADFFVDGVRDDAQYLRDVYNVERVEALKGSNAMVFGRGGGGGVVNRVSKEAQWTPTRALTLQGGSWENRRALGDVGQGFGDRVALRLNGMYEDSRFFRDATSLERRGINPTAAFLVGGTMVRAGYEYFADRRTVDRGLPSFRGRPSTGDVTTFFGDPDASRSRLELHAATLFAERQLPGNVTLRNRARFARYDKFYQNVFPGGAIDTAGNVNLSGYNNGTDRTNWFNQTDLVATVATGAVKHVLLGGVELGRQDTDNRRETAFFGPNDTTVYRVAAAAPTVSAPVRFAQSTSDADNRTTARVGALYLQDQVELGRFVQAIGGVRWDRFSTFLHNNRNGQEFYRRDDLVSPRAGLVLKPVEAVSVYSNYSVSFLPSSGDQFSSLTASSQTLRPERFTNRELGLKWDARRDLAFTAALYRLDRTNTTAPDPANVALLVQTGKQRTTGWEAGVAGQVTDRWQLVGGFAAQTAKITSRTSSAAPGRTVPLVPARTLSLWNRLQLHSRLGAGLGVIHQDEVYAAIDNAVRLPAFTRLDGALFVTLAPTLRLQANVENLLDREYYPTSHGNNNIMPGATRTLRVSLQATR